jgi:hypothetical protein
VCRFNFQGSGFSLTVIGYQNSAIFACAAAKSICAVEYFRQQLRFTLSAQDH